MLIIDKVYGKIKIQEPILLELLDDPAVLRLKKISQFGMPNKYYHYKNYSRYEHSVGVMILLREFGATIEEQIAGLLHDVSHTTFSHVADWVFMKGEKGFEDYQDKVHNRFIRNSGIPKILREYGFSVERILDKKNFTLLENEVPDLCSDRIDYSLREFKIG